MQRSLQMPVDVRRTSKRESLRRGVILLSVLVALLLIGTILSLGFRLLVVQRTHLRREGNYVQGKVLADSAIQRAKYRLRKDAQFSGETWRIPGEVLQGGAVVEIGVSSVPDQADSRQISIRVRYPDNEDGTKIAESARYKVPVSGGEKE